MRSFRELPIQLRIRYVALVTTAIVFVLVVIVTVYRANKDTEVAGLTTARAIANQIVTLRTFYTDKVVGPAKLAGMDVTYDFAEKEKAIPLPATMVKALGDQISKDYPGSHVKLYSNHPFLHHKQIEEKDDFEKDALKSLGEHPDDEFYRMEDVDGRLTMRFAVADVMRESCVNCHNTHPMSPKKDWKTGDVRGVVEVMVPVDKTKSQLYTGSLIQGVIIVGGFVTIVLLTGVILRKMTSTLDETITTVAGTSSQIAATVETHEHIALQQSTAMEETTTTMEQLGESSQLSAQQAETGAKETTQSLVLAEDGARTVQQTIDAMTELKENVSNLTQEILSLSDRIDQIGEISTFVGELSNQTNLLAMNAAVEAAHAGQQGKGFAVVATEIRKLADQSAKSVSRISDLVTDIQQATNSSVLATEEGTKVVDQAMVLTEQTAEVFNNLATSVSRAAESVQQISLNNKEQASGINQVVEAIESLNIGARESVDGLQQTSDGLQTLNQAVLNLQTVVGTTNAHRR